MRLNVLNAQTGREPWYAQGLAFTCTQCGNCCSGPPGFVWISDAEIVRLAEHLEISPDQVVQRYCRKVSGRWCLQENLHPRHGGYDCVFLQNDAAEDGRPRRRGCSIYSVRPLQCRTWPFWPENLRSAAVWQRSSQRCPGINHGTLHDRQSIEALRDCKDWPPVTPDSD